MPPSKSKLQTVVEESTQNTPSITAAVKSIANILLGPRGQTPIDNIIQMQHYQLWGFILIVAGLLYIVWLMQKKLDNIDKQYKEQFVLLHRLFKSHQDLQVEVRRNPTIRTPIGPAPTTTTTVLPPTQTSLEMEEEDEIRFDEQQPQETFARNEESLDVESVGELVEESVDAESVGELVEESLDAESVGELVNESSVDAESVEESSVDAESVGEEEEDYEVFE